MQLQMLAAANGPSDAFSGNDLTAFAHTLMRLQPAAQHGHGQPGHLIVFTKYTVPDIALGFSEMAGRLWQVRRRQM
jgi:hypothetical protein